MILASIQKIHSFQEHPNADSLVKAKVLNWPVVVRKEEFVNGELVVFIFPDVIVDKDNPYFEFMSSRNYRVWIAKFRKELSCGLVCPLSILEYYGIDKNSIIENQDIGELIRCQKFEKNNNEATKLKSGDAVSLFPKELISITDEDNLLSNPSCYLELQQAGPGYITKKMDGTSATYILYNDEFMVCSRRLRLKDGNNTWWNIAKEYNIEKKLRELGQNIAIQGEIIGPGINNNCVGLKNIEIRIFNVKSLDNNNLYNFRQLKEFCSQREIPMVNIVELYDRIPSIDYLQSIANYLTYSKNNKPAEGIVIRPIVPIFSSKLGKNLSVKLLNQNYK